MPIDTVDNLIYRAQAAWVEMDSNRSLFQSAYDYVCPFRNTYNVDMTPKKTAHHKSFVLYDSTAMIAAQNFVNTMQQGLTPLNTRWAELRSGPAIPENMTSKVNAYLDGITKEIFKYIDSSNFATASAESYYDLGIGTMVLYVLEGDDTNPLIFSAAPMSQIAIEDGKDGSVNAVFRKSYKDIKLAKQIWPDAKLSDNLKDIIKHTTVPKPMLLYECTYYDDVSMVWRYDVIVDSGRERIVSREFPEQPTIVARWMKIPGYSSGIGPFLMAAPDYKTLNQMKKLSLEMAALNVYGTYTIVNSANMNPNTAIIAPGAFIPVESNGGPNGPSISRLPDAGNFQIQEFMLEDLKSQIRQIMLDNRLPLDTQPGRTAFEIAERIKELQTNIGASYGRLQFEYITPLFKRIVGILSRKGLLDLDPQFDITIDNIFIQVQVLSPIASLQKVEDVNKLINMYQFLQSLAPEVAPFALKKDELPYWLNDMLGGPSSVLVDKEMLQERIEESQQQMQAQQVMSQLQGAS